MTDLNKQYLSDGDAVELLEKIGSEIKAGRITTWEQVQAAFTPLMGRYGTPHLEGGRGFGYGNEDIDDEMRKIRGYIHAVNQGVNPHAVDAFRELNIIQAREIPAWRERWGKMGITNELDEYIARKVRENDIRTARHYQNNIAKRLAENPNAKVEVQYRQLENFLKNKGLTEEDLVSGHAQKL
jgi:hypothetical protein